MRLLWAVGFGLLVSACGAAIDDTQGATADAVNAITDGATSERSSDAAGPGVDTAVVDDADEADAASDIGDVDHSESGDVPTSDDAVEVADAGAPLLASCTVEMTVGDETETLLDMTFEGFEENVFGATVYGHMLKVWAGVEGTGLEILIRTEQTKIPGVIIPGTAGSHAWVLMMIGGSEVYTTQTPGGIVTITTCPSEEGMLVSGNISNVVVYEMGTLMPATLNGSFEVVLGHVDGEVVCSGL